jgi:hypothetical protein
MRFAMFARAALTVDFYMRGANPALKFDDLDVRMTAYRALLAGAASHTYGNNNIWQMWGPGREPRLGADTPWKEALDHPGAFQMGHLRRLFESRPWELLVPDQDLLVGPNPPAPSRSSPRHRPGAAATGCSCSTMRRESTRRRRRPGSNSHLCYARGSCRGLRQYAVHCAMAEMDVPNQTVSIQRRLRQFHEFGAWESQHRPAVSAERALEAATSLYDLLPPASRVRPVDASGVIRLHSALRVLMPSR